MSKWKEETIIVEYRLHELQDATALLLRNLMIDIDGYTGDDAELLKRKLSAINIKFKNVRVQLKENEEKYQA